MPNWVYNLPRYNFPGIKDARKRGKSSLFIRWKLFFIVFEHFQSLKTVLYERIVYLKRPMFAV